ncbi:Isoflavone reductase family protein [Penicillium malachiteum]|uniref:Isoflavone reductase family protein n=1 Tax=Penicillium malachiteum TaxID=1324776 RepID=A0AAD6HUG6_9EURO|nr:Isoflavone reductase family protein [Penicillium malachiteum]
MTIARKTVLLVGATGATGNAILKELVASPLYDVIALIRKESVNKPRAKAIQASIRVGDASDPIDTLVKNLEGVDILISAIAPNQLLTQVNLATAAKKAGVGRMVPCSFSTVCPVGNVVELRDQKEVVHQHMYKLHLPYTIIDNGFWYQASFPQLPSGKLEYAMIDENLEVFGDGNTRDCMTDLADIARYTVKIIGDERTLNKKVFCYGTVATQNEVMSIMEKVSGEKVNVQKVDPAAHLKAIDEAERKYRAHPEDEMNLWMLIGPQYNSNRFIRADNTPENAWYSGYLDARQLYPDFRPRTFEEFATTLVAGKEKNPYMD